MNQVEAEVAGAGAAWRWSGKTSDEAVLKCVRAGETAAYEMLVHRYNPRLRRAVRRVLSNETDVEDVLQEAHFNAFRFIWQFSGRSSFATWLTRITVHAALARLRRPAHSRELNSTCVIGNPLEAAASSQRDPEQRLQDKEMREALKAAVRTLPETYRAVYWLREFEELSTAEVAVLLQLSEPCVKTRLHRAKALLRRRIQDAPAPSGWANAIREILAPRNACSG